MSRGPALLVALAAGLFAGLAAATAAFMLLWGIFWIFLFGDDPWPGWTDWVPDLVFPVVALMVGSLVAWLVWKALTRR